MKSFRTYKTVFFALAALSMVLSGCVGGAAAPIVPTPDQAALIEQAVATVYTQLTEQALANPTATLEPTATVTPEPTATTAFTATPAITQTAAPTATTVAAVQAEVAYVSTWPESKAEYLPNEWFGLAIAFKNTGTTIWEPGYKIKLVNFVGEPTVQTELSTEKAVKPGEKVEFGLWAFGSEMIVRHTWTFQLYNPEGVGIPGGFATFTYQSITN